MFHNVIIIQCVEEQGVGSTEYSSNVVNYIIHSPQLNNTASVRV